MSVQPRIITLWQWQWDEATEEIKRLRAKLAAAELQLKYEQLFPNIVAAAKAAGYAIALHGSLRRDCDLIACPWTAEASDAETLVKAIACMVGGVICDPHQPAEMQTDATPKPHGRRAWSIQIGGGAYVDLSVMPRNGDEPQLYLAQHEALAMRQTAELGREKLAAAEAEFQTISNANLRMQAAFDDESTKLRAEVNAAEKDRDKLRSYIAVRLRDSTRSGSYLY